MKPTKEKTIKQNRQWNWWLLPLQFILAVLPLILYVHISNSGYSVYAWHSMEDSYLDVFLHGKMIAFMLVAAVILVLAVYKTLKLDKASREKLCRRFIPLFLYAVLVILSTICSEDILYSLKGAQDAKEPMGVLLGYVAVAFYACLVVDSLDDISQLVDAALLGGSCMALLGVLQTIGKDPLITESVQRLFAGNEFVNTYGMLELTFPTGQAYGTLFNPNYVGTYVALYVPLLLAGLILYKKPWKKAVSAGAFIGLMVMLFASQSRTGLIAVIAVAVVALVFLGRNIWKYWYLVIPGITFVVLSFSLLDTYRDNLLSNRLKEMFSIEKSTIPVLGVDTTENGVRVVCTDTEYTVKMLVSGDDFAYSVMEGEEPKEVTYAEDRQYGYFTLNSGEEISIQTALYENRYAFGLVINGRNFYFTNQVVAGNYKYINEVGRLDECIIPQNVFQGYEAVASGRGYSWGRSIPLLLDNVIVGSGPDTFAIEFPQNDYVARYQSGFNNVIFTRPHNFYLQMGIQTGMISLLAFLTFYAVYFVGCCRRYAFRRLERVEQWLGFAMFLGTIGFMASGLANDSLIVVTPIFYVLLGCGMAINNKLCPIPRKVRTEQKKEKEGQK